MALEHKRIAYKYVECDPYKKPKELLELNPKGLVLVSNGVDRPESSTQRLTWTCKAIKLPGGKSLGESTVRKPVVILNP